MSLDALPREYAYLPDWFVPAVTEYVETGIIDEPFLGAVLENNLQQAIAYADETSLDNLKLMVQLVFNHIPGSIWGSPERVQSHQASVAERYRGTAG